MGFIETAAKRGVDKFFASEECDLMLRRAVSRTVREILDEQIKWKVWAIVQPPNTSSPTP